MLKSRAHGNGFTLIELLVVMAIMGILLGIGIPTYKTWLLNAQIRTAAESVQSGIQLARAEAVRRNTNVRFQLVDSLTSACALSSTNTNWVVGINDPSGKCDVAPSDTTDPLTIQERSQGEGSSKATVATTPAGSTTLTFNGLGRVVANADTTASITQLDFDLPTSVLPAAESRNLRILIDNPGGQIRFCDPNAATGDLRKC